MAAKAHTLQRQLPGAIFKVYNLLQDMANADEKGLGLDIGDLM